MSNEGNILAHLARTISALLVYCMMSGVAACADDFYCKNATNVVVHALKASDALIGCAGAGDAIRFLEALGLITTGKIELRIVDELPGSESSSRSGCYIMRERCAYLLTFATLQKQGTPFDLPIDHVLYQSMAAHEVAHVIAAENFIIPEPRIEAQEYIAYVTMLGTMPANYREMLLAKFPGGGFATERAINSTVYLFNPPHFGAQAFRHFLKKENGRTFIQRILAGQALVAEDGN